MENKWNLELIYNTTNYIVLEGIRGTALVYVKLLWDPSKEV